MKILWAIDAFEDNKTLNDKMIQYLTTLNEHQQARVTPVYLHRQTSAIAYPSYEAPIWFEDDTPTAVHLVNEVVADYDTPFLEKPILINHTAQTLGTAVEKLSAYAVENNFDLIVTGTHGRTGFDKYLLGSFTETLINHCAIPIVTIPPHSHHSARLDNVLFPTDFGENCKASFEKILSLCRKLATSITVYHSLPQPVANLFEPSLDSSIYNAEGKLMNFQDFIEMSIERKKLIVQNWQKMAQVENIDVNYIFDQSDRPIDQAIIEIVNAQKIDQVIMEAQSGPFSAALLGSITRKALKSLECPLIVLPKAMFEKNYASPNDILYRDSDSPDLSRY